MESNAIGNTRLMNWRWILKGRTIKDQILRFIQEVGQPPFAQPQNLWLKSEGIDLYIRASFFNCDRNTSYKTSLDIATIVIAKNKRGKGLFSDLMSYCLEVCQYDVITIENVGNKRLFDKLTRDGWIKIYDKSFYLPVNRSSE